MRSLVVDSTRDFEDQVLQSDIPAKLLHRLVLSERRQLMPGLRYLVWNVRQVEDIRAIGPLIPPSLAHLDLVFHPDGELEEKEISLLIKSIGPIIPQLQYLRVRVVIDDDDTPEIHNALASTLLQLKVLSSLELPDIEANKEILNALATCPKIVALELKSLAEETGVPAFVKHVVTSCPSLESVVLHLPSATNAPPESDLPFRTLSPLLRCSEIRSLRVLHPRLILMSFADIYAVNGAWPRLRTLHLCGGMSGVYSFGTALRGLKNIAIVLGPKLVEFGQYFVSKDLAEDDEPVARFQKLQTLDFGYTSVPQRDAVGFVNLLGAICPPGVNIKYSAQSAQVEQGWRTVTSLVGVLHRAEARGYRQGVQEGKRDHEATV